jgi:signal transduction histidine kinase
MFRGQCVLLFLFCSSLLWAKDTLVPNGVVRSVLVSEQLEPNWQRNADRRWADHYRAIADKKIRKAHKENKAVERKIHSLYEVERKEIDLGKLRMANNENRALSLKLQNNLLLASLWTILTTVAIALIVLFRWRIEHEKRSLQIRRAAFAAREKEKLRFSRELHDDFQSTLSIIHMIAVHEYEKSPQNKRLVELKTSSKHVMEEIRKMSDVLYPREINTEGWHESLNSLIRRRNEESPAVTFFLIADAFECDKDLQLAIYRGIEELIYNTNTSSTAKEVFLSLRKVKKGIELGYMVGVGAKNHHESDAKMIQERMHGLGGKYLRKRSFVDNCEFKVLFCG